MGSLTTLSVKAFVLISNISLLRCNLRPCCVSYQEISGTAASNLELCFLGTHFWFLLLHMLRWNTSRHRINLWPVSNASCSAYAFQTVLLEKLRRGLPAKSTFYHLLVQYFQVPAASQQAQCACSCEMVLVHHPFIQWQQVLLPLEDSVWDFPPLLCLDQVWDTGPTTDK